MADLYDADGELTRLGSRLRLAALLVAILSGIALVLFTPLALLAPMLCDVNCSGLMKLVTTILFASPLMLLIAAVSGAAAFNSPSRGLLLLTFIPGIAGLTILTFILSSGT